MVTFSFFSWLYNPYGAYNAKEFNHWQEIPDKTVPDNIRGMSPQQAWVPGITYTGALAAPAASTAADRPKGLPRRPPRFRSSLLMMTTQCDHLV